MAINYFLTVICALPGVALSQQAPVSTGRVVAAMGSWFAVTVQAAARPQALAASERAVAAMAATEARLSSWRGDSEVARLHAAAPGRLLPVSPATAADLALAMAVAAASDGAFAPLLGSWHLAGLAVVRGEGARIDEGGFGKGSGLDAARAVLRGTGAVGAVLDLGGQVALWGESGPLWVPLAHPRRRDWPVGWLLLLPGESVATSGNGERPVDEQGRRVPHLFDRCTGRAARDFGAAVAVAPGAALADAASTALFVAAGRGRFAAVADGLGVGAIRIELQADGRADIAAVHGLRGRVWRLRAPCAGLPALQPVPLELLSRDRS